MEEYLRIPPFSCINNYSSLSESTFGLKDRTKVFSAGSNIRRLVSKSGEVKVVAKNVPGKTRLYLADIYTTMIDLHWKWVICVFSSSYIISWMSFAIIWWLVVLIRGSSICVSKVCQYFCGSCYYDYVNVLTWIFTVSYFPFIIIFIPQNICR